VVSRRSKSAFVIETISTWNGLLWPGADWQVQGGVGEIAAVNYPDCK
jgi:hypothetical protein